MIKLKEVNFREEFVLLRANLNVPLQKGKISDDKRLKALLPTINYILKEGAKQIIIIGHLGRPDGRVVEDLRLNPVAERLSELLNIKIKKLDDCIGIRIPNEKDSKIIMLENLRFHEGEEANDDLFARKLAVYGNVYVNEAFADSAKAHASIVGIPKLIPSCAGFQFEEEVKNLTLENIKRPAVAILGGAKVSDKIELIENLLKKVDVIIIGGAMSFTFFKAMGFEVGKSKYEYDKIEVAKKILENYKKKIALPVDIKVADKISEDANIKNVDVTDIKKEDIGVDIGEQTINSYKEILALAKTIIWNGPLGICEIENFAKGTESIAKFISGLKAKTIVGGGDTGAVITKLGLENKMTFVSTAGGAAIEFLEGKILPGIEALEYSEKKFLKK
ncbi:MAG: phosphoglycerate kinase [Candidatus Woesearchaeota archaeon]